MILTETEINKISGGSVDYFDRIVFAHAIESALLEKLRGGVELPEPYGYLCDWGNDSYGLTHQTVYYGEPGSAIEDDWNCHPTVHENTPIFTRDQVNTLLAARALASREQAIEECKTVVQKKCASPTAYDALCALSTSRETSP